MSFRRIFQTRLPRRHQRFNQVLPAIFFALVIAACSSQDSTALPENQLNPQGESPAPGVIDSDSLQTTTTPVVAETPSTSESSTTATTEPPLLGTVQVSPSGSDSNYGGNDGPVASVERALARLAPGGTIEFESGLYPPLLISGIRGTADSPIRFVGLPGAVFSTGTYSSDAGILIENSNFIELSGMTVRQSLWGIYVTNSTGISLLENDVADIGQEAIRIKDGSSSILIDSNRIANTGQRTDDGVPNGEGIYIGTGTPGGVDLVNDVTISNNTISGITDEAIDIKRPATNISIIDNTITDIVTHTSGAIVVYLNNEEPFDPNITIERNVIRNVSRSSEFNDGNCIVVQATVTIINNVLHNCQHRGIYLRGTAGTATILHNTFIDTGSIGGIINEGLGIDVISENNLGVAGAANKLADASAFVAVDDGDYRLLANLLAQFQTEAVDQVEVDLLGADRETAAEVTAGAIEASE